MSILFGLRWVFVCVCVWNDKTTFSLICLVHRLLVKWCFSLFCRWTVAALAMTMRVTKLGITICTLTVRTTIRAPRSAPCPGHVVSSKT